MGVQHHVGLPWRGLKLKNLALDLSKKNKNMKKIIYLSLILSFILPQTVLGIGQMTEPIVVKDVLKGQEVVATLNLFNSEEEATAYGLKAEGEIADWASFYQIEDKNLANSITEIQIPAKSFINALVKFKVPEDAPNGDYQGEVILFNGVAGEAKEGEVNTTVFQSVGREVSITVTDEEIIKLETAVIPVKYAVNRNEPLQIKIIYENLGNIIIKPDLQLKILKDEKVIYNAIFPYPEDENAVKPSERKELSSLIEWQTIGQENGEYRAEIKVLYQGDLIQEESFRFNVGTVINAGQFLAAVAKIGGGNMTLGWIFAGLLLVAGAAALIALYKSPKLIKVGISKFRSLF